MIQETFAEGESPFHRMDPRLKIVVCAILSFQVALCENFSALVAAFAAGFFMIIAARLNPWQAGKRLLAVNGFILLFWLMLPLTYPGKVLYTFGPVGISEQAVFLCARITLKSNAIMMAFIALLSTSRMATIGHAMSRLKLPDKLVHLFLLTYRYLFVIRDEYQRLRRAAKLRCFHPATDLHTYKTYAYLVGMLFVRASARAERVYHAMLCRGFKRKFYSLVQFRFTKTDWAWSLVFAMLFLMLGYLEWTQTVWF